MSATLKRASLRRSRSVESPEMMQALTRAMEAFPQEERVQYSCLKVMRHIVVPDAPQDAQPLEKQASSSSLNWMTSDLSPSSTGPDNSVWLGLDQGQGMVTLILQAMQACPQAGHVHAMAVTILTEMCQARESVCEACLESGALIRLSETMTVHRRTPLAQAARRLHTLLTEYEDLVSSSWSPPRPNTPTTAATSTRSLAKENVSASFSTLSMESKEGESDDYL